MRIFLVCVAITVSSSVCAAEPDADRVKKQFKSDNYTVTWGAAPSYDRDAELEIGSAAGHGGTLTWLRFMPGKDGVEILSIKLDLGWKQYESKWPPDEAPVKVTRARMKADAYGALLRDLAVVDSAVLKPADRGSFYFSSHDFWASAHLTANNKTLLDLDWAGYERGQTEIEFAKPRAAVALAREATEGLEFKDHALSDAERRWASEKFVRDWKKFKDSKSHWWVRGRYIVTIGVVGDKSALPLLRDILGGDPKDSDVYYAINAITRLTGKDVRDKPVEEMDVEKTRRKVLELLRDVK